MKAVSVRRHRALRPARLAMRKRRSSTHPSWCTCRGCHRWEPSDRRAPAQPSTAAMILAGLVTGLVLVAILAGPKAALLAATGIVWGG